MCMGSLVVFCIVCDPGRWMVVAPRGSWMFLRLLGVGSLCVRGLIKMGGVGVFVFCY